MNHKTNRTLPRRVYSFSIHRLIPDKSGDTLGALIAAAREMQRLWNFCVVIYDELRHEAKGKTKEERVEIFNRLYGQVYPEMAKSWLPSTFYKHVLKKFQDAKDAFMDGVRKAPRERFRLDKFILPHVDTNGGKPVSYLTELRDSKPYYLASLEGDNLTRGFITINDRRIWFEAVIHRDIPAASFVKQFAIASKRTPPFGWQHELQITLEVQPELTPSPKPERWIAIDIGWRKRRNGLRVAYWMDYTGAHGEIVLPFNADTSDTRKRAKFSARFPGWQPDITDWRQLRIRQSAASIRLDEVKKRIRKEVSEDWPEAMREALKPRAYHTYKREDGAQFKRVIPFRAETCERKNYEYMGQIESDSLSMMREKGVRFLAMTAADAGLKIDFLEEWKVEADLEYKRQRAAHIRLMGRREWLYRTWAARLAKKYDVLIYEGDFNIKNAIERPDQDAALKASQKYRQTMAAPHLFRQWLLEAFKKEGKTSLPKAAAHSTGTCPTCGANVECGPELFLRCENDHVCDQDFIAVRNLAREDWPEFRAKRRRRASKESS